MAYSDFEYSNVFYVKIELCITNSQQNGSPEHFSSILTQKKLKIVKSEYAIQILIQFPFFGSLNF